MQVRSPFEQAKDRYALATSPSSSTTRRRNSRYMVRTTFDDDERAPLFELPAVQGLRSIVNYNASTQSTDGIPLGFTDTEVSGVTSAPTSRMTVANAILKSAVTVIDLALTGGSTPTPDKKVFPIRDRTSSELRRRHHGDEHASAGSPDELRNRRGLQEYEPGT